MKPFHFAAFLLVTASTAFAGSLRPADPGAALGGFVANRGQSDPEVRMLADGAGARLAVTADGFAVVALRDASLACLRFRVAGCDARAAVAGVDRLAGERNFFAGSDPSRWVTGVPSFASAVLRSARPGIDLAFHAAGERGRTLEYDVVAADGADVASLRLDVEGADELAIDGAGALVARAGSLVLRQTPPRACVLDAAGARREVDCRFRLAGERSIAFDVAAPAGGTLVIDPSLVLGTYLGGSADEQPMRVEIGPAGGIYVAGGTFSADFPLTPGVAQSAYAGNIDAFVAKLDPTGSSLVYATYLGGGGWEECNALAVDGAGRVHLGGRTESLDYPTTAGAAYPSPISTPDGFSDGFAARLAPDGASLVWSTYIGGNGTDSVAALAVDSGARTVMLVATGSGNYPGSPGSFDPTYNGPLHSGDDLAITALRPDGTGIAYSTFLGGSDSDIVDSGRLLAIDAAGTVHVAGRSQSPDFPVTPAHAIDVTPPPFGAKGFVARLSPDLSQLLSCTFVPSGTPRGIAVKADGATAVVVESPLMTFPTTPLAFQDGSEPFGSIVFELSHDGGSLEFATYLGASFFTNRATAIALDDAERVHLAGVTGDPALLVSPDAIDSTLAPGSPFDTAAWVLSPAGSCLAHGTYLGASGHDIGAAVAIDPLGRTAIVGRTTPNGTTPNDFPVTVGALDTSANGGADAFLAVLDLRCAGAFEAYGAACSPTGGSIPQLRARGCPTADGSVEIEVRRGRPNAPGVLLLGLGQGPLALSGNCALQIAPLNAFPVLATFSLDAVGRLALFATLPSTVPAGSFFVQAAWLDAAAVGGIAASNPLRMDL